VLDCEGLSRFVTHDHEVMKLLAGGRAAGFDRVVSGLTLLEAAHVKANRARWDFALSELRIEPVSVDLAHEATALLRSAGLSGHKYAIDAVVALTAMHQPGPVVMLTSDVDDMARLCDGRVKLVAL